MAQMRSAIEFLNERRVLLARVGWMKRYDGSAPDDKKPLGGGSYNERHKGHELFNFHNDNGIAYGFVQPAFQGKRKRVRHLNLARIVPGFRGEKLNKVLIIFVAKHNGIGPQEVVGWYRNATVFRISRPKKPVLVFTKPGVIPRLRPCPWIRINSLSPISQACSTIDRRAPFHTISLG